MIKSIVAVSKDEARARASDLVQRCDVAVVSILDSWGDSVFQTKGHILELVFDDIDPRHVPGDVIKSNGLIPMAEEHAEKLSVFVQRHIELPKEMSFVVHCSAGISRSGAVALFVRDVSDFNMEAFRMQNGHILPNAHVFELLHSAWSRHHAARQILKTSLQTFNDAFLDDVSHFGQTFPLDPVSGVGSFPF